mmetsp:Transcript_4930/g.7220  ORF Transcript_4930/g.7220 Transcript_4930/m.7220 type:complete len:117 (-) Transcript_4930:490-840(-)
MAIKMTTKRTKTATGRRAAPDPHRGRTTGRTPEKHSVPLLGGHPRPPRNHDASHRAPHVGPPASISRRFRRLHRIPRARVAEVPGGSVPERRGIDGEGREEVGWGGRICAEGDISS